MNNQEKQEEVVTCSRIFTLLFLWITILYRRIRFWVKYTIYYPLLWRYRLWKSSKLAKNRYTGPVQHIDRYANYGGKRYVVPLRRIPGFTHVF